MINVYHLAEGSLASQLEQWILIWAHVSVLVYEWIDNPIACISRVQVGPSSLMLFFLTIKVKRFSCSLSADNWENNGCRRVTKPMGN